MWGEVPCAFRDAAFDVCLLGFLEISRSAGSVAYVFEKWAAPCVRSGSLVGVIFVYYYVGESAVSRIRQNFWMCFAVVLWR